jgi:2-isopropylmalate synthase
MHKEFADVIQKIAEKQGEVAPATILDEFVKEYLTLKTPYEFLRAKAEDYGESDTKVELNFIHDGMLETVSAIGNGPLDAVKLAMQQTVGVQVSILDYSQHALGEGSHAKSAAYICMRDEKTGKVTFGVGVSSNITKAGMRAVFSALNRLAK